MERLALDSPPVARAANGLGLAAQGLALLLTCAYLGRLASTGTIGFELQGLFLLAAVAIAIAVPPHVFVALALAVFGTYSLSGANPLEFGGVAVYSPDVLLAIVLLRALLPRERGRPPAPLDVVAKALFGAWALVMAVAGVRAALGGYELASIIRLETPLIYGAGFYIGFGRIVRERDFKLDKAVRNLMLVALGFVAYMAVARVTNNPFEGYDPSDSALGTVITTGGVFRRDYGFASAFILYPVLALAGAAYLLYSPRRTALAATVACIGTLATLLTLIRGEILGLFLGLAVIAVLRNESALRHAIRMRAIVAGTTAFAVAGLGLWMVNAPLARGILERSLPGLVQQTESADATAEFRRQAIDIGLESASREPTGIGLIPGEGLTAVGGVPLGYIAHSGVTTLLVYAGWVGLVAAVLALLGLIRASFRLPRPVPWLHPFFVASLLMMVVYSFAADGLVGQGWVTGTAALIAALRFQGSRD